MVTATYGGHTYTYAYDNAGNILSVKKDGTEVKTYGYGDSEWKDLLTEFNGDTITYDQIGNPLSYRNGFNFTWSNGRQLTSVTRGETNVSYLYDADGMRTQKTINGITTDYYYLNGVLQAQKTGDEYIIFLYDENGSAYGMIIKNGETVANYYYLFNAQGDVIGIIDQNGEQVVTYEYGAWGDVVSVTGSLAQTVGAKNPIRYRGYYYDGETGFYYLQSRYYDPYTARFINADGYVSTGQGIIGNNMFAYCLNNPLRFLDNMGCRCVENDHNSRWVMVTNSGKTVSGGRRRYPSNYVQETSTTQNCYSYAFGLSRGANPGDFSKTSNSDYMFKNKNMYTPEEITIFIERDMSALNRTVRVVSSPKERRRNEYIVAMKTSTQLYGTTADYHFARQLRDGTWADKPGKEPSRWNEIDGTAIAWDLDNVKNYYNTKTVYFAVEE